MSDAIERIKQQLNAHKIVLYMKGSPDFPQCGFSARAVEILKKHGAQFFSVDVLADAEIRQAIKEYGNWPTIPQLYVNGELIGGSDILMEMEQAGELESVLQD